MTIKLQKIKIKKTIMIRKNSKLFFSNSQDDTLYVPNALVSFEELLQQNNFSKYIPFSG